MSDVAIYDRTGEVRYPDSEPAVQWSKVPSDAVLHVDRSRSYVVCQFFVAPESHEMYVCYRTDRIKPSLDGFYHEVRDVIEENGWKTGDATPGTSSWVFPNLDETESRSFGSFPHVEESVLDIRVIDHLVRSDVERHLGKNFDPEATVKIGTDSYERSVQVAKYALAKSAAAVAITESQNADVVDDADLVFVYESNEVLRPLNPVVLENGLVDLVAEELSGTVAEIESAVASPMGRFYSLSVLRSLIVDDGWAMDYDRNLAHDATVGVEDTFGALRPPIPELPAQTEGELVGQIDSSMESVADEAVGEFLEAIREYVRIVEGSERLDPWEKLEEVVRCVRVLEALEDGDVPPRADPEVSPGVLEWSEEHPLLETVMESDSFDRLSDLVRDQERLVQKNDDYDQIGDARQAVENVAGQVAEEMVGRANEALEKTAEDETVTEKYGRFQEASVHLAGIPEVYRNPVYRHLLPHQLRRRLGGGWDPAVNEPDDHETGESGDEAYPEFDRTVKVLRSHANHDVVAEYLRELEEDVESRRGALVDDFLDSVRDEAAPVVEKVKQGTDESIPGREIATALDEKFSETRFTVHVEREHRRRLIFLVGVSLFVGLVVGIYWVR